MMKHGRNFLKEVDHDILVDSEYIRWELFIHARNLMPVWRTRWLRYPSKFLEMQFKGEEMLDATVDGMPTYKPGMIQSLNILLGD